jgi:hypothetical protein
MVAMRYWYDWEFLDNGERVWPISIGIVAEDGRELYLVNEGIGYTGRPGDVYSQITNHHWLMGNVVPHLPITGMQEPGHPNVFPRHAGSFALSRTDNRVVPLRFIANAVRDFLTAVPNERTELWGYFPAYDHVLLAQLWGPMSELPTGIPMRTHCVAQYADMLGVDLHDLPQHTGTAHNALDDARWTREAWQHLERLHARSAIMAGVLALPGTLTLPGESVPLFPDEPIKVISRPVAAREALAWAQSYPGDLLPPSVDAPVLYEPDTCPDGAACQMHAMRHVHPLGSATPNPKE